MRASTKWKTFQWTVALCTASFILNFLNAQSSTMNALAGDAAAESSPTAAPWWHRYPIYVGDVGSKLDSTSARNLNATLVSGNYGADPTWGPYGQAVSFLQAERRFQDMRSDGIRWITWTEAFGECMLYAAELDQHADGTFRGRTGNSEIAVLTRQAWNWESSDVRRGNAFRWIGLHNTVNNEDFVVPRFSCQRLAFPVPYYPNRDKAVGFLPKGQYPLNAQVYDAVCAKDINGHLAIEFELLPERANHVDPDTGERDGSTEGLYPTMLDRNRIRYFRDHKIGDRVFAGVLHVGKDPAAPFWTDYVRATVGKLVRHDVDGVWCDNYSSFNNLGMPPIRNGFGAWSEHRFRQELPKRFTSGELTRMGIDEDKIAAFDIKSYLKRKAVEFGAKTPSYFWDPAWRDSRWQDEPVWNAYKVFKQQIGQEALRAFYKAIKDEARAAGREDFLVAGNDMPVYALGWARDQWLDMVSSEQSPGWFVPTGSRGIMLPPLGKYAVVYRAGLEHQKGPYATVWYYLKGPQEKYRDRPTLAKVLFAEGFANATFLKYGGNPAHPGTPESVAWWNRFVRANEDRIGRRRVLADVGLYFSPDNQLANVVPGSHALEHDRQPHSFGHWGFGTAMIDGHVPYRVITDWKLSAGTLAGLSTLIIPNAECLDDRELTVLETWVRAGGRLVASGPCGIRYSTRGRFARRHTSVVSRWFPKDAEKMIVTSDGASPAVAAAAGSDPTVPLAALPEVKTRSEDRRTHRSRQTTGNATSLERALGKGLICWSPEPIGMEYYMHETERSKRLPAILSLIGPSSPQLLDPGNLPGTVGTYLWQALDASSRHIDLVNYAIDLETDRIEAGEDLAFRLRLPDGWKDVTIETIAPDETAKTEYKLRGNWVAIRLNHLVHYACIKITRKAEQNAEEN